MTFFTFMREIPWLFGRHPGWLQWWSAFPCLRNILPATHYFQTLDSEIRKLPGNGMHRRVLSAVVIFLTVKCCCCREILHLSCKWSFSQICGLVFVVYRGVHNKLFSDKVSQPKRFTSKSVAGWLTGWLRVLLALGIQSVWKLRGERESEKEKDHVR